MKGEFIFNWLFFFFSFDHCLKKKQFRMLMQINKLCGIDRLVIKASSLWALQNSAIHCVCVCVHIRCLWMREKLFFVFHYPIVLSNNLFQDIKLYIILLAFLQKGIIKSVGSWINLHQAQRPTGPSQSPRKSQAQASETSSRIREGRIWDQAHTFEAFETFESEAPISKILKFRD